MLRFLKKLMVTAAVVAGCLACFGNARAQAWKQIGNLPAGTDLRCAYFWDKAHGVVGGVNCIYTYRSGVWTPAAYPEAPDTIKSFRLLDGVNLYAAGGVTSIWKSTDSGATWELTPAKFANADDVYTDANGSIKGMNISGTGMMQGTTFARLNAQVCAAARDDQINDIASTDGGVTWQQESIEGPPGYNMVADICAGALYTLSDGPKPVLEKSTNGGKKWFLVHDFESNACDIVAGAVGGVLYVQRWENVYCSRDGGSTFKNIGGPASKLQDRRMFVFGPYGQYLIDMDSAKVWLWNSGINMAFAGMINQLINITMCQPRVSIPISAECSNVPIEIDQVNSLSPELIFDSASSSLKGSAIVLWFNCNFNGTRICKIHLTGKILSSPQENFDTIIPFALNDTSNQKPLITVGSGKMAACSKLRVPVIIKTPCGFWSVASLGPEIPQIGFPEPFDTLLTSREADTIWFDFSLFELGRQTMLCDLRLVSSIIPNTEIDTLLSISVTVGSDNLTPRALATNRSLSNCNNSTVPLILQSLPCDSIQFTSCTLTISSKANYTTSLSFPRTLAAGEIDTLLINFPPQNLNGAYIITAHVTGKYLGSIATFDTTIQIRVTFTSSAGALIASDASVTLDTTSVCSEADTIVTLTNLGCDSITVTGDATTWLPGWSASDPQFPFPLAPDSSFTVRVHYTPSGPAWSQQSVAYSFQDIGGNSHTSSQLVLDVTAVSAPAKLSLSDTALSLGIFSRCNASGDTTVTLTNLGCDSLTISNATLIAGTGFTLLAGGDTVLAPNQSATFKIGFSDSVAGSYATALHIHAIGAHGGAEIDTTIPVTASVIAGSRLAALSTQTIALGTTSICEELDSSITITNTGCEPDTITRISFANTSFASLPPLPSLPIIIPLNGKVTIPIATAADTTGLAASNTDTLRFSASLDQPLPPVILSRGLTYPGSFAMSLASEATAPIQKTVPVYVLRKGTVPAAASELDFALTYDNDLLSYTGAKQPDIDMIGSQTLPNGLTERSFAMKPATDRDTIATLDFESYLTKNEQTPITLSGQQFLAAGETSPPCIASLDTNASGANFTLELACGDSILHAELDGAPPFTITSIVPNPATATLRMQGMGYRVQGLEIQLYNAIGNCVLSEHDLLSNTLNPAPYTLRLDVSTLPSGIYLLRVSAGSYTIAREFVIAK